MTTDQRVSLLAVVRQPIEINLCQLADAATRHAAAGTDNSALAACVAPLHQVSGALRMIQYHGAARFCAEIESAVRTALRATPADKAEAALAGRGADTLREFVNAVAAGGAYTPLQLFAAYRELARISGNATVSEKDLFFPDAQDNAPAHAQPRAITPAVLPALVKDLRSRYQRGLLGWLKDSAKADGLKQMRDVLDALHQIAAQLPQPRGVWWASANLTEAVIELLADAQAAEWVARVKPVFSRIDFLLRDLAAKGTADTMPAQRDVFYAIASCRVTNPRLQHAQQVLGLVGLIPEAQAAGATQRHQPQLDDARIRLENIKQVWTDYIAGEPKRLARFRELLDPLTQKTRDLGNVPLLQLLLAISAATPQLPDPYPLDGQVMSLEMASALLMVENIIYHFNNLPSDLDQQVAIMTNWLATAVEGKVASSPPPGLRADIVQQANDEKLRIVIAREILKSLQQVERAVDAYANDPAQRIGLEPQASVLRQVRGVFDISNQKRAARLATACQHWVERCLAASTTASEESRRHVEWLAEALGSLGFYLEPCLNGKEPAERAINLFFTRHENQPGFEALLDVAPPVLAPSAATPAAAITAAPAPRPEGADREMLEIFLEEASAVLTAMETSISQARNHAGDHDALINIRRAFHTLKGSARMVGLAAFGECGWEMEQLMNHWLAQGHGATPELLALADDARVLLAEWAHALQGEAAPAIDAGVIDSRARALRGEPAKAAASTPAAAPPRLGTHTMPQLRRSAKSAPPRPDVSIIEGTATRIIPPPPAPPALEQTLADLGERLLWMHGLVEEIQQQAASADNAGAFASTRVAEIAQMMGESVGEALALQRALKQQLAPKK